MNYNIKQFTITFAIKNTLFLILFVVLMISASTPVLAQSVDIIDSLITIKNQFKKNENIEFYVKFEEDLEHKTSNVRLVPTMSCKCGNKDFYYELYTINDFIFSSRRKPFLIHNEKPDASRCACKSHNAEFYDKMKYFIPSINERGKYMLIIRGNGFVMYSNVFVVID